MLYGLGFMTIFACFAFLYLLRAKETELDAVVANCCILMLTK